MHNTTNEIITNRVFISRIYLWIGYIPKIELFNYVLELHTTWGNILTFSLAKPVGRVVTGLRGPVSESYTRCSDLCYSNVFRVYSTDFAETMMTGAF